MKNLVNYLPKIKAKSTGSEFSEKNKKITGSFLSQN